MEFLTPEELLSILKIAHATSKRDHLLILFAYSHGLRASEVCNIRLSDIKDGSLTVVRLKHSKLTIQPLVPHRGQPLLDEIKSLKEYLKVRPRDAGDVLFPSKKGGPIDRRHFHTLFHNYAVKARLPEGKRNPHLLKHSICSHLVKNGADIAFVQVRAGHVSLSSTQKYVHLNDSEVAEKTHDILMNIF